MASEVGKMGETLGVLGADIGIAAAATVAASRRGRVSCPGGGGTSKRLQRELAEMLRDPPPNCTAWPMSDDLYAWEARIEGPAGSPYAGGSFVLDVKFPRDYPFSPPALRFRTPIYHCNVDRSGEICLDILNTMWSPALTAAGAVLSVCSLLADANPLDPLVPSIAQRYLSDRSLHDQIAAEWTRRFAMGSKREAGVNTNAEIPDKAHV